MQLIGVMNRLWLSAGLNLGVRPYGICPTSCVCFNIGMPVMLIHSFTTAVRRLVLSRCSMHTRSVRFKRGALIFLLVL
jgi:hypothetical protein